MDKESFVASVLSPKLHQSIAAEHLARAWMQGKWSGDWHCPRQKQKREESNVSSLEV